MKSACLPTRSIVRTHTFRLHKLKISLFFIKEWLAYFNKCKKSGGTLNLERFKPKSRNKYKNENENENEGDVESSSGN
ncbi:hypothetical protein QCA50_019684 [Cerrena zonata]|uniref:Uncharacterized protein n=1 Tax=Cerrena zonata TaxID=2478898 RepID=A0AAW0FDC1_9APHY